MNLVPGGPFRVKCLLCGTVAESWHRDNDLPGGAVAGMASCACGNCRSDSGGFKNHGRIVSNDIASCEYLPPTD